MPSSTPGDSRLVLDGLCVALTKLLDVPVSGINSASYQDLASELEKGRVDYAWMSPTLMLLTSERIQLRPLLSSVRDNTTEYCSALFVDDGFPADEIDDLHNSTVAWVDTTSAAGYLIPRLERLLRSTWVAVLVSAGVFALLHLQIDIFSCWSAFLAGLVYGIAFAWSRRLWPIAIAHSLYDLRVFLHHTI